MVLSLLIFGLGQVPTVRKAPLLATAAGITAGLSTLEGLEHRFGKGQVPPDASMGNARVWYDPDQKVVIRAAAGCSSKFGQVVEGFEITWLLPRSVDSDVPRVHIPKKRLGLLAKLKRYMSEDQVEQALHVKLDLDKIVRSGMVRYSKPLRGCDEQTFRKWEIDFIFDPVKGLGGFEVTTY